jgi:EAL domain-containing protein (putative c-di-GMP-specific phosphodiesterase class I)
MARLELPPEICYRFLCERSWRELPTVWPEPAAAHQHGLAAEQDGKRRKFDDAFIRQYMEFMLYNDGFRLHYQPQYAAGGSLRGVEALLRLPHPEGGFIGPDRFIPLAEESGLIEPLGFWVIRQACLQMKQWHDEFDTPVQVGVNVSPRQLSGVDFARKVLAIVDDCGARHKSLELEITEQVMLKSDEIAGPLLTLSEAGIQLAMDDFGAGYSSILSLHRLPFSTLKLDRFFVQSMSEEMENFGVVEALISIGHSLEMEVIAEGVEREYQRRILKYLSCDAMQGFLFSPAVPADAASEIIARSLESPGDLWEVSKELNWEPDPRD